ncbi:rna (guanine-9-)-methyltransferase domain-containing [Plasmopara halstedii]|uniref:tRNA (guanine(9)-N(1))-methyltransferase n=1 Tax=Plasmopara halstedii TaxID=4781 RepID=A0A0P1AEM9_PLAHL|nr:rna (guanine-9-)-methyltransferase domain-containing [Plasmopara halstedii]CEG39440.1 rna (guanine-9-)-methyltransferase domain-containing [Plasmopara halstedii]|eukprot:XP_024575809.1 rna (guanine-9-)-methyltransferase domain-containing [Plasmopara halstedii]
MTEAAVSTKHITVKLDGTEDDKPENESTVKLSRRAMRREKRHMQMVERKELKKLRHQEEQRAKKAKGIISPSVELDMSDTAILRRRERNIAKRETLLMAAEEGSKVVIDCAFDDKMSEKEKKSLSQQIMFSYGVNRRSSMPMNVYITSLHGDVRKNLEKISGFHEWQTFAESSLSYMDIFKKESLVYLTADSPNTITKLCRDKVYIIGGIVDRNRLKGITYEKAIKQGIETAKLPLDAVVDMGSATRVLTVNHVFEILTHFSKVKNWAQATLATLPSRKGVHFKETS